MKFLFDTNVLIQLEPVSKDDMEPLSPEARELLRRISAEGHEFFLHPKILKDIKRDNNIERRQLRLAAFEKYPVLEEMGLPSNFSGIFSAPSKANDDVDNHLLAAICKNAVHVLVTEDQGIHRKARTLGIEENVLQVADALDMLRRLKRPVPTNRPAIEKVKCYKIDVGDPLFDSLRSDYAGFDSWFREKCQRAHRDCFAVKQNQALAGICVLKEESDVLSMDGKILKICTFKIGEHASGFRFGELLLRAALDYAYSQDCRWVYVTVFPKHESFCLFLQNFGFRDCEVKTDLGECVMRKQLIPPSDISDSACWEYHVLYGPKYRHPDSSGFIVPIQPHFHDLLFPDLDSQGNFLAGSNVYGNGMLKAYLCRSNIKEIPKGSQLFFYRSQDQKSIQAIGVVEKTLRSSDPESLAAFVGKRTVYEMETIVEMCKRQVLAILFRQANSFASEIRSRDLRANGVFVRSPESIQGVKNGGLKWMLKQPVM